MTQPRDELRGPAAPENQSPSPSQRHTGPTSGSEKALEGRVASLREKINDAASAVRLADNEITHGDYTGDAAKDIPRARAFIADAIRILAECNEATKNHSLAHSPVSPVTASDAEPSEEEIERALEVWSRTPTLNERKAMRAVLSNFLERLTATDAGPIVQTPGRLVNAVCNDERHVWTVADALSAPERHQLCDCGKVAWLLTRRATRGTRGDGGSGFVASLRDAEIAWDAVGTPTKEERTTTRMEAFLRDFEEAIDREDGRGVGNVASANSADAELLGSFPRFAFLPDDEDLARTLGEYARAHGCQWLVAIPADEVFCPRCDGEGDNVDCPACCGTGVASVLRTERSDVPNPHSTTTHFRGHSEGQ